MNNRQSLPPRPNDPISCWCWHVAAGQDKSERRDRLSVCPEEYRTRVEAWVRRFFANKGKGRAA